MPFKPPASAYSNADTINTYVDTTSTYAAANQRIPRSTSWVCCMTIWRSVSYWKVIHWDSAKTYEASICLPCSLCTTEWPITTTGKPMATEQQILGYFGTVLKCVSLCGDGAASGWLGSSFFGYLSWSVLACVVMVQQVADLVRVFLAILALFWSV